MIIIKTPERNAIKVPPYRDKTERTEVENDLLRAVISHEREASLESGVSGVTARVWHQSAAVAGVPVDQVAIETDEGEVERVAVEHDEKRPVITAMVAHLETVQRESLVLFGTALMTEL